MRVLLPLKNTAGNNNNNNSLDNSTPLPGNGVSSASSELTASAAGAFVEVSATPEQSCQVEGCDSVVAEVDDSSGFQEVTPAPAAASVPDRETEVSILRPAQAESSRKTASTAGRHRARPVNHCASSSSPSSVSAHPAETSACGTITDGSKKRQRSDSKPPARSQPRQRLLDHPIDSNNGSNSSSSNSKSNCGGTMAGGRRNPYGREDDDDEEKYDRSADDETSYMYYHRSIHLGPQQHHNHHPPLENEPPVFTNNASASLSDAAAAVASSSSPRDPADDAAPSNDDAAPAPCSLNDNPAAPRPEEGESGGDDDDHPEELAFRKALKARGLEIVRQRGDGNCLFRAVSLQVYGDANMHGEVRDRCMDFLAADEAHFGKFVTEEAFADYVTRKRIDGVHGNNLEIQVLSELFNRPVEVFTPQTGAKPLNIFHAEYKTSDAPIRLSYHDGNHYNAVIDPLVPTAGLGLGLPGLQPGLADKMQVAKAVAESDEMADQMELEQALKQSQDDELQRALKESTYNRANMYKNKAIALSDLEATNYELEQAALEVSLESYRHQEHGRKQRACPNVGQHRGRRPRGRTTTPSPPVVVLPQQNNSLYNNNPRFPAVVESSSSVAAIPPVAAAAAPPAAVASRDSAASIGSSVEYPQTVQELVMNGFDLRKVVHAYEFIGDNFDDLLAFLMSSSSSSSSQSRS